MRSSLIVCVGVVPVGVVLATLAGFAFGTMEFPGKRFIFAVLMLGLAVPYEAIVIALYYNLKSVDLTNTYLSVILPLIGAFMPFGAFWMRNHFASTAPALIEAAQVDGASSFNGPHQGPVAERAPGAVDLGGALLHVELEPVPARVDHDPGPRPRNGAARPRAVRWPVHDEPAAALRRHVDRDRAGDSRLYVLPAPVHRRRGARRDQGINEPGPVRRRSPMTALEHANELDEEYPVGEEAVERFRADGFVKLARRTERGGDRGVRA